MTRALAILYGIVFLILGIVGFIPEVVPIPIASTLILKKMIPLSILFLGTGIFGVIAGLVNFKASRIFFQIIGILYGMLAILGFIYVRRAIFGFLPNSRPHTWFYVIVALTSLIFGFGSKREE